MLGDAIDLTQAQTGAFAHRLGGKEGFEHLVQQVRRNPCAGVAHRDHDACAAVAFTDRRQDRQGAAIAHGVAGVDDEVQYRELQLVGIGDGVLAARAQLCMNGNARSDGAAHQILHAFDELIDVDGLQIEALST